jgi:LPXTG-motif cell wall-anchored protein
MMQKFIVFGILLLVSLSVLMPSLAKVEHTVMVTDYKVDPEVLMPGDIGTITVTIANQEREATQRETTESISGDETKSEVIARDLCAEIESVSIYGRGVDILGKSEYTKIGALGPGQSTTITFRIEARGEGKHSADICIDISRGGYVRYPIPINVDGSRVELIADDVPSVIPQVGLTEIKLNVANTRPNTINAVMIEPEADGIDFTPDKKFIGTMSQDETAIVNFTLNPTSTGEKNLNFNLSYKNGDNLHVEELIIPINVIYTPDVELIVTDLPRYVYRGDVAKIEISVTNARPNEITGVTIVPSTNMRITPLKGFIGSMDPDDDFSVIFDVDTADLSVNMTDPLVNTHTISFRENFKEEDRYYEMPLYNVSFDVIEPQTGVTSALLIIPVLLILIVLIGGYYVYRRKKC